MIPQVSLNEWREKVGWADLGDVEQDLIISRVLIEIFSDQSISSLARNIESFKINGYKVSYFRLDLF